MKVLERYRGAPKRVRLHTWLRAWTCPMEALVAGAAPAGRLLDVGCGHGLLSLGVAAAHPTASVLGVDLSEDKIR